MLSLIVALESAAPAGAMWRFALSRDAAPGVHTALDANADGLLADQGTSPIALLPRSDELVAVVPAAMLSWHQLVLPRIGAARLRNALDGVLEERVLDDPASLHFALSPDASAGEPAWIAACDKAWLHAMLQAFESAGRPVSRVVPEYTPVPAGELPVWYATGVPENAWLVRCADDGVQQLPLSAASCDALGMHHGMAGREGLESMAGDGSGRLTCFAEPAVAGLAESLLGARIEVLHPAQRLVLASRSDWDLAQFDLASTGRTRMVRRAGLAWTQWLGSAAWRPARWALVVLLLSHLLGINIAAWKERAVLQAKRSEIRQVLTQTFPKVTLVVDAPVQMERELANMRLATGAVSIRDLESMLATVAANTNTTPAPTAIDFTPGDLTLKGFQPPEAESRALTSGLAGAGYIPQVDGKQWRVTPRPITSAAAPDKNGSGAKP